MLTERTQYLSAACSAVACLASFGLGWDKLKAEDDKKGEGNQREKEKDKDASPLEDGSTSTPQE